MKIFQIDVFTNKIFKGNPAAVCPLDHWPDDTILQSVAAENNLSETAFFVRQKDHFELRWFTPVTEVDLCGHATMASAFVIFTELDPSLSKVRFRTKSGELFVTKETDFLKMSLPSIPAAECEAPDLLIEGLGHTPSAIYRASNYLAVYNSEREIKEIRPDFEILKRLDHHGVIITAPGDNVDFVSRFFAPKEGINEDPVTGSAHSTLTPYWAERTGKTRFNARQVSERGGDLKCELSGSRVLISGNAVKYMQGELFSIF